MWRPPRHIFEIGRLAIYAASLLDYNNGHLHGTWIEADENEEVSEILEASPAMRRGLGRAEEWAIHDHDGFGPLRLGEYVGLQTVARLAGGIREHGPAFAAWIDLQGNSDEQTVRRFDDAYLGEWDSLTHYAQDLLDDLGVSEALERQVPEGLRPYVTIDAEAFGRDLELGGDIDSAPTPSGTVWLFATQ
jgi:antirestriction protein